MYSIHNVLDIMYLTYAVQNFFYIFKYSRKPIYMYKCYTKQILSTNITQYFKQT